MPGDPNECRANAKQCLREAASARTSTDKLTFETLAQKWLRLAADYDTAQRLVTEWGGPPSLSLAANGEVGAHFAFHPRHKS